MPDALVAPDFSHEVDVFVVGERDISAKECFVSPVYTSFGRFAIQAGIFVMYSSTAVRSRITTPLQGDRVMHTRQLSPSGK